MALTLVTAPTVEPLTIAEVKSHLRLDSTSGEPAPTAPTVALVATSGSVTAGAHRYRVTFVTADGETEGGTISSAVTTILATHGQVALTAIPVGGSAVTSRKLYRTAAAGSSYLLLTTLSDNTTTTYTDNIADGSLGAEAPTTNTTVDPDLTALIVSAREYCESYTHRALLNQTWDLKLDAFPDDDIWLPFPPVSSVTSVTYTDTAGASQTWASADYITDLPSGPMARMARITPAYGEVYPSTRDIVNAVTVRYVCGYGATSASVPSAIKSAARLLIGHWYEHRESVNIGNITSEVPQVVASLLWPYKSW